MAGYRTVRGIALAALALLAAASSDAETPLSVAVVTVEKTQAVRHLSLTGELAARETLNASFPTGGRIAEIAVDDGDRVRAGTVIARIERFQQEQALLSAQAQLTAADAELTAARDDNARQTSLLERGATTRAAQDAAEHRLAAAVARRAQAEAELARAQEALDDTVLRASAEATVIRRLAEPGQVVGAAQPILELAQGDGFDAVFEVPEALLSQASATAPPEIRLSPLNRPGIWVAGQVREISPLVNTASGTVEVKVALEVPLPGLSYGDAVQATLRVEPSAGRIVFDHLAPEDPSMRGQFAFYGPTLSYDGLEWRKGRWQFMSDVSVKNAKDAGNREYRDPRGRRRSN